MSVKAGGERIRTATVMMRSTEESWNGADSLERGNIQSIRNNKEELRMAEAERLEYERGLVPVRYAQLQDAVEKAEKRLLDTDAEIQRVKDKILSLGLSIPDLSNTVVQ